MRPSIASCVDNIVRLVGGWWFVVGGLVNDRISQAPTRTATARRRVDHRGDLLEIGQVIISPETRLEYQIERLLGQGGFGQVYLAAPARQASASR